MNANNNNALLTAITTTLTQRNNPELWIQFAMLDKSNDQSLITFINALYAPVNSNNVVSLENLKTQLKNMCTFFNLNNSIFDILDSDHVEREDRCNLIVGLVQSGKSAVICGIAMYNIVGIKRTTVVIVRNLLGDYRQLRNHFSGDGRFGNFDISVVFVGESNENELARLIETGRRPSLVICLENHTEMRRLNNALLINREDNKQSNFDLIIDEADSICHKKNTDTLFYNQYTSFETNARAVFAVTATSFENLKMNRSLQNNNIYCLPIPDNYKGVESLIYERLPQGFSFNVRRIPQTLNYVLSEHMREHYYTLQDLESFTLANGTQHPIISLQKSQTKTEVHLQIVTAFARDPRLQEGWVAIAYNGNGVTMFHHSLTEYQIGEVKGVRSTKSFAADLNILNFKGVSIGETLQALKDSDPDLERFHHIAIFAGLLADRGINFVSNRDYQWHLTHEIYKSSSSATMVDMVQSARICGCYNDDIPLTLYLQQSDEINLRQTSRLHQELIQKIIDYQGTRDTHALCEEVEINANNVPRRKISKKTYLKFNQVLEAVVQTDEEWGIPHLLNNIRRALQSGRQTIVIKILRFLLGSCPERRATREEIESVCDITNISNYTTWSQTGGKYCVIQPINNTIWGINPVVLEVLNENNLLRYFQ